MYDALGDVVPDRPIVFVGPSLDPVEVRRRIPNALVLPPVRRGDLYAVRECGGCAFLILDGVFAHTFAVSPREVVDVLRDGAQVLGASSMGALRAADCHPAGMVGVGLIYRLFRLGILTTDDEVAVATNDEPPFEARSTALVNIRYSLSIAVRRGCVRRTQAEEVLKTASAIHFSRRDFTALLRQHPEIAACCQLVDLKSLDAERGINYLKEHQNELTSGGPRTALGPIPRPERYVGHDRFVGRDHDEVKVAVTRWLWATGRYQRYLWPLLAGEPLLVGLAPDTDTDTDTDKRPGRLRESAGTIMSAMVANLPVLSECVFAELEFLEEADAEIMRWYAVQRMAADAAAAEVGPSKAVLAHVREEVAVLHGFRGWDLLVGHIEGGLLWGAIPFDWIDQACEQWATARTFALALASPG